MRGEELEALGRDRGEQPRLVAEVMGGRRVRHPGSARHLAQAQMVGAHGLEGLDRSVDQRTPEVAVEMGAHGPRG